MNSLTRLLQFLSLLAALLLAASLSGWSEQEPARPIEAVRISGVINPVTADFVTTRIEQANAAGAPAFLLEIDTPGGLDTAMREIIQGMLGSRIPVVVYVFPPGARAASAGALITLAADIAAMAPGTNLGASHPVAIGPGADSGKESPQMEKAVNDAVAYARSLAQQRGRNVEWAERIVRESISTPAAEALELKVIDLVAEDEAALLVALDGRKYLRDGEIRILSVRGVELRFAEMSWRQRFLNTISHPTVAYLLFMLGILGIFFEISQPGVILPGAVGAIALLLALYSFQGLPINYAGVLLILLALVLFLLEIKVQSFGMLTVGGIVALTLGSLMLVESSVPYLQISREVILATVAVVGGFCALVLFLVAKAQRTRIVSGAEGMAGERGRAVTAVHRQGQVFVHGEYWDAVSAEPIDAGEEIEVIRIVEGLKLEVKRYK